MQDVTPEMSSMAGLVCWLIVFCSYRYTVARHPLKFLDHMGLFFAGTFTGSLAARQYYYPSLSYFYEGTIPQSMVRIATLVAAVAVCYVLIHAFVYLTTGRQLIK